MTMEQLGIIACTASEANIDRGTAEVCGRTVTLEAGQALVSSRGFEKRYRLGKGGRYRVMRAWARAEALGILSHSPAIPAPPPAPDAAPSGAPSPAPRGAPPPTLITFRRDAGIIFPALEPAPPPAPSCEPPSAPPSAPSPAPIQQGEPAEPREHGDKTPSRAPAARRRNGTGRFAADADPDPRHRPLQERLEAVFLEVHGKPYGFNGRDAKAITELLRLSGGDVAEVERRWRVGLSEAGFRSCDTIHELADRKWNAYARARAAANVASPSGRGGAAPAMDAQAFTGTDGGGFGS